METELKLSKIELVFDGKIIESQEMEIPCIDGLHDAVSALLSLAVRAAIVKYCVAKIFDYGEELGALLETERVELVAKLSADGYEIAEA